MARPIRVVRHLLIWDSDVNGSIVGQIQSGHDDMTGNNGDEPLFRAVRRDDPDLAKAHALAAESIDTFRNHVLRAGEHDCWAKLRFRDPDLSEETGEDQFLFLWLAATRFHSDDGLFSAEVFELPEELSEWHQVGQRLAFESEDIFDWAVNERGTMHGGYTLRVARAALPEENRAEFDRRLGVEEWAAI